MRRWGRAVGDKGETLIELVAAIAILGVCVVAIGSGIVLSIKISDMHRSETTANAYVRSYAEAIENTVANSTWQGCSANSATYQSPAGFALPSSSQYTASVSNIQFWNGSAFTGSCSSDYGLQQLTLTVASTDSRATEQLTLVIRKPCASSCS